MKKYRTCNLCEALCGIEVEIENNKVVSIRGDKNDPLSQGHICPKAYALKDVHEDIDRLKQPIRKIDGEWQTISWEEAIDYTTTKLLEIQAKYGNDSVGVYQGNPSVHNLGTMLYSPPFIRSLRTKNRFSATSVDQLGHHLAAEMMFGNMNLIPIPDINRTDFWLIIGGNPLVSNGSLMTAPNVSKRLKDIQKRGGKVVVIDPRKTQTAKKADQHIFVKPGTDIWLLLAMLNYIFKNDKVQYDKISNLIPKEQIDAVQEAVKGFTVEIASQQTGISTEIITNLIEEFTAAKTAICYGRLGISIVKHGTLSHWVINAINILTGNFDQKGGVMFTSPAINMAKGKPKKRFNRWQSRVRNLPEFGGELPASAMAEEMLETGAGQIKAMITSCGNPVLSTPNGQKLDKALESLEFMVSVDIYLNETTRHANIILPPVTGLETAHLALFFHTFAIHNTIKYSEPTVEKEANTKFDWEIFAALTEGFNRKKAAFANVDYQPQPSFDLETTVSYLLHANHSKYSLQDLKNNPNGIDLGALEENIAANKIISKTDTIDLFPTIYKTALANLEMPKQESDDLLLFGRRDLRSMNSWLHNSYRMVKGKKICTAQIHPNDAQKRNINNGDFITVESTIGKVKIEVEITEDVAIGSISIPHGWGHNRKGTKLKIAEAHAGVSYNDLADENEVDEIAAVAALNGIRVRII
ncbi:MAG: molybdopterin-dependent oxidoreductase [Saprospiraceae bacterium]